MNMPAVIAPSIIEKPPKVMISAPLMPPRSVGSSVTDIDHMAVSCEAESTFV